MSIPITTMSTPTGLRLRQLHDVALASPPATTALPLVYAPSEGRWKAQQLTAEGLAPSLLTDLDARWVNVTGDTMSNGLTVAYSGVPRISSFKAAGSLQRPAYDFERWKTTVGTIETVDVGSSVGTIGFSASSSTMLAYGGAIYAFIDAPVVGGDAPISIAFFQSNRQTHIFDSYGRYFLNPPADVSGYSTAPGLIIGGDITMATSKKIVFADSVVDNKIQLYSGGYTIGIRGGTQGYFVPASSAHRFYSNNVERFNITDASVNALVPMTVGADTTGRLTAEIMATRAATPTHGLVYLGNTGTRYLLWDTGTLQLQAGAVEVPLTVYAGNTNGSGLRWGAPPGGHQWLMYSQGTSAHLSAAQTLFFRDETNGVQPLELLSTGTAKFNGRIYGKSDAIIENDLHVTRTAVGSPTTGVLYFGNDTGYLYFNGTQYQMPTYPLFNRGREVVTTPNVNARNISVQGWTGNGGVQTVEMGVGGPAFMAWVLSMHDNSMWTYFNWSAYGAKTLKFGPGGTVVLNTGYQNVGQSYLYMNQSGDSNGPNVNGWGYLGFFIGYGP